MPGVPFAHTLLHVRPELLKRSMVPPLPVLIHINQRPMHIIHINILQPHQFQRLLQLQHRVEILMREGLGGDEQVLAFASTLRDHLVDSVAQGDLVVV